MFSRVVFLGLLVWVVVPVFAVIPIGELSIMVYRLDLPISSPQVLALIMVESGGDPLAESQSARGLMQVSPAALQDINRMYRFSFSYEDMFVPEYNVLVGSIYFAWLLSIFEVEPLALMAYNWGIGNVYRWLYETDGNNKHIKEAVPLETKNFVVNYYFWLAYFQRGM